MFINDLGMVGGGCHAVNAIHWHTVNHGSTQREAGRQRTRRLVDIHINAKLGLCSAAMSPSWSPDRAAWSPRTHSFIFIPAHPLWPKLSRDVSKDVWWCPQNAFRCFWCSRKFLRHQRTKFGSPPRRFIFDTKLKVTSQGEVRCVEMRINLIVESETEVRINQNTVSLTYFYLVCRHICIKWSDKV